MLLRYATAVYSYSSTQPQCLRPDSLSGRGHIMQPCTLPSPTFALKPTISSLRRKSASVLWATERYPHPSSSVMTIGFAPAVTVIPTDNLFRGSHPTIAMHRCLVGTHGLILSSHSPPALSNESHEKRQPPTVR